VYNSSIKHNNNTLEKEKPGLSDNDIEGHLLVVFYLKTASRQNAKKKYRFSLYREFIAHFASHY